MSAPPAAASRNDTSLVAVATWLTVVNALPPSHGTRFPPGLQPGARAHDDPDAGGDQRLHPAAGDVAAAELERFGDAIGDNAEFPDMDTSFGDAHRPM